MRSIQAVLTIFAHAEFIGLPIEKFADQAGMKGDSPRFAIDWWPLAEIVGGYL
jgi:hypothetical protein